MTSNLDEKGLRSIVEEYDVFFIDIWGVLHDGLNPVSYTHLTLPTILLV